jgi:hypothetical protein
MVYVPTTPIQPPSLEAQEIAREIENVIVRYQDEHPRTTQADVQQALQLAQSRVGKGLQVALGVVAAAVGVVMLIGLLTLLVARGGDIPWIAIASIGIMVIAIVPLVLLAKQK